MDWVVHILFESPLKLLAGIVLLEAVLATVWWFRPGRTSAWLVVAGLGLGTVLMILQHLVVTDRERIERIIQDLALAVDCEDVARIEARLDEGCQCDGMHKEQLLARVASAFERAEVDEVKVVEADIAVDGDCAEVVLRAHCRIRAPDWPYDYYVSAWKVQFVRRDDEWLVHRVRHTDQRGVSATDLLNLVGGK